MSIRSKVYKAQNAYTVLVSSQVCKTMINSQFIAKILKRKHLWRKKSSKLIVHAKILYKQILYMLKCG